MKLEINRGSTYAPIRYEATRPYALTISSAFIKARNRGEESRFAFIKGPLLPMLQNAAAKIGRPQGPGPGPLQNEILNTQVFASFLESGKIIFDISKTLSKSLLITDAENIPCGELPFPAESFYLHFGNELGLCDENLSIEGAFVSRLADRMLIDLAYQGFGKENFLSLPTGDSLVGAPIYLNDPAKPIVQALSESIADVLAINAKTLEKIAEVERQLEQEYGHVYKAPSHTMNMADKEPLLQKALSLIVNTMFYLAAEPGDITEEWAKETPKTALDKLKNSQKSGEIKTTENTLRKAGYSKIKFIGKKFEFSITAKNIQEATDSGKTLSTHFRRGHFRRQPYGPDRALRKTIFVAPVVVNSSNGDIAHGRVYDVSETTKNTA